MLLLATFKVRNVHQWFLCCTSVEECRVFKPLILRVVPELSTRYPSWLPVLAARQDRSTGTMYSIFCCVVFCGVWYVVLRGILCFAVFCALFYFVLHITIYRALIHYFVSLVLNCTICAAHCFVPFMPCIDPSFVPCTIHAVHKWCCQQLKLRWRSSIANGRRRLHKALRPCMVAPSPSCEQPAWVLIFLFSIFFYFCPAPHAFIEQLKCMV